MREEPQLSTNSTRPGDRALTAGDEAGGDPGQDAPESGEAVAVRPDAGSGDVVEVRDGDEYDAETAPVDGEHLGGPVDPPDEREPLYATITRWRDHEREPLVPAWMRNRRQRVQATRWAAGFWAYAAALHVKKSPKYLAKTALWGPIGVLRTIGRVLRWATAEEGNWALRQQAANRGDAEAWLKLDHARRRSASARWWWVGGGALVVTIGVTLLLTIAPWWLRLFVVCCAWLACARIGRPADRPIIDRVTTGPRFVKLTAEMVRTALCSIGIPAIKDPGSLKFPQDIGRDGPGWLARVNLPAGVEAVKVMEYRGRLSSALRLPVDQVWPTAGPDHAGQLDLWVGFQPASKMGQPKWSLAAPTARTCVFEPAEFGTDQRQRPVKTALFEQNFLIGGRPGSGKSFGARTLATIAALDPTCEMKIVEYKGTGDFLDLAPLCSTYTCGLGDEDFATGLDVLNWGLAEAARRGQRIKKAYERGEAPERKVTPELARRPGSGLHPVFILIDEAHELFGDSEVGGPAAAAAERLAKRGRALAITLVICTQIPDKDSLPTGLTRCIGVRWCMAVPDQVANDQILGTGAYKRGLTGTVYRPRVDAGWGIITGLAEATAVRSQFPTPATAKAIVARATTLRGGVVGDQAERVAARDMLADARAVLRPGEAGLPWAVLAERLAELAPEVYDGITADMVRESLARYGVQSQDVKVGRSNVKGARRTALDAAEDRREIPAR
jgi:S-DNA-T family DNA segregation ATPase FtsK/SpoIIIE